VLVDPRLPGYAELPGIPVESSWFIAPLGLSVVFLLPVVLISAEEIRHRQLRSAAARGRPTPPLPGSPAPAAAPDPAD
jgi:hypothetical protein